MLIQKDLDLDLSYKDYDKVKGRFIELCDAAGITKEKIGFFGNVGFPGVSDLDAFVCDVPERLNELEKIHRNELERCPKYRYIFWHTPVFLPCEAIAYTSFLHTLKDLEFQADGLKILKPSEQNLEILHIIWFLSLIRPVVFVEKQYLKKKPVSLRHLLLVYKNLAYSDNVFSAGTKAAPNIMAADSLREYVKLHYEDLNGSVGKFIYHNFFNVVKSSLSSFDDYCRISSVFKNELSKSKRSYIFLSLSLICRKNKKGSSIKSKGKLTIVDLNPHAFNLIVNLINNDSNSQSISNYLEAFNRCKEVCNSHNIDFPFIEVAPKPEAFFNRMLLFALNKITSVL